MVSEDLTYKKFGYYFKDLSLKSNKKIIVICNKCKKIRIINKYNYRDLCKSCRQIGIKNVRYKQHWKEQFKNGNIPWNKGLKNVQHHSIITRKKMSEKRKGKNHWNWKNGSASLGILIRNLFESKEWRNEVFKRDNYTCQECMQYGGNLETHHKIYFNIILREFLQFYNQFSPIEDKETLVRLAITYESFWNVSNGLALCKDCHKKIKHIYKI